MNDPIWKLMPRMLGQTVDVVWRKWPDGREESCLVTSKEYLQWLSEGNVPTPADEVSGE